MNSRTDNRSQKGGGEIERRAKQLFDDSVDELDAHTRSRLNQGRQRALASLAPGHDSARWAHWLPAAGVAASAAIAIFLWQEQQAAVAPVPSTAGTDFELLMDETSLEMLEDLEFYSWIDFESADGNVG